MILTEVVLRPTEKSRSVGPHKLIPKKNGNKKKSCLEKKKFRSMNKSLYGIHVDFDSDDDYVPQQRILYTNGDNTHRYWYIYSNNCLEAYEEPITHH